MRCVITAGFNVICEPVQGKPVSQARPALALHG